MGQINYVELAKKMRAMITEAAKDYTDDEALKVPFAYPKWKPGMDYLADDRVRYGEKLYKVLQDHSSQEDWTPTEARSLFAEILPGQDGSGEEIGDWVQPDSTNPYMRGDKVRYNGVVYQSLIDNNVWSPEAYPAGWQVVS
jgi:hypothetical protein